MSDVMSIGVSGLMAFQRALDVTSHNIANASTPGYSRQTVEFGSADSQLSAGQWFGSGVDVLGVRRAYDQTLLDQARSANASLQQFDAVATYANRFDSLFSDAKSGVSASLQQFNNSIQTLTTSPGSGTVRQLVLNQAQGLVTRLQGFQSTIDTFSGQIQTQMNGEVAKINSLAKSLATVNAQIVTAKGQGQGEPNDLLDKRDALLSELGSHVGFSALPQDSGAQIITIGSGQVLVGDSSAGQLSLTPSTSVPGTYRLTLSGTAASGDVTDTVTGGSVGGLLQLRSSLITPAQNALGRVATAIATLANQQQAAGLDLNGNFGSPLFSLPAPTVTPSGSNTGSASAAATISDVSSLTTADYVMKYQGGIWSLTQQDNGAAVAMTGTGTPSDPFKAEGLSLVVSGTPKDGDTLLIRPTHDAISGMRMVLTSPNQIAAASPLITTPAAGNNGTGTISDGTVPSPGSWVRGSYTLTFTDASHWEVRDAGNNIVKSDVYSSGGDITFNGMQIAVSGSPAAGDQFSITANSSGSGDSRNAQALSSALGRGLFSGGTLSINDAAASLVANIGLQSSQAQSGRDAQSVLFNDANSALSNATGVNLDEEASNLLRYQQAYQAAARVISASNSMFQSLMDAVR